MSAKIDIIAEGYANMIEPGGTSSESSKKFMKATGSCCLVRSNCTNLLFDTMGPWEKDKLLGKLNELKIHPDDIHYLVCSHSHPDHIGNINLFTKARKHFIGTSVYSEDLYDLNCFEPVGSYKFTSQRGNETEVIKYANYQIDSNLTIEPTQGHTMECISLIVNNCETYLRVGLVGDLFECEQDVTDEGIWLAAGSQNPELQRANRSNIYNRVDYIVPGHGPLFKT